MQVQYNSETAKEKQKIDDFKYKQIQDTYKKIKGWTFSEDK